MELSKLLENVWGIFVALGWWMLNRLTQKIDNLEGQKADSSSVKKLDEAIHDLDRRVDELGHTSINRSEFKGDVTALHLRLNEHEQRKADRVQQIKLIEDKKKK